MTMHFMALPSNKVITTKNMFIHFEMLTQYK